jgi:transcriptional regulator with XRE-family HTH domain
MSDFGRNLRAARERAGLSQTQLGRHLGFSQPYVSAVEAGRRNLTLTAMNAFARAVGCTLSVLLTPIDSEKR